MARLVQQSAHVLVHVDGIHEYQRQLLVRQGVAKASGRLALAIVEVKQARRGHALEVGSEIRRQVLEDRPRAVDEVVHARVGLQSLATLGVDAEVPRSKAVEAEQPASPVQDS